MKLSQYFPKLIKNKIFEVMNDKNKHCLNIIFVVTVNKMTH